MRWIVDDAPGSPEHNMAADAALLAGISNSESLPAVRVYTWDRPAVSIGRLQHEEPARALFPHLPLVRRPTGGRAVLHGADLTIAVALCLEHLPEDCRSVMASHHLIMSNVLRALQSCGVKACFGGCALGSQSHIVDCFEMTAACDLIDGTTGQKLVGSAQRRESGALLQQMSLPAATLRDQREFLSYLKDEFQKTFSRL